MGDERVNITIERLKGLTIEELPVEIVERKGKGHPDSLCDRASEELSIALCNYYLREFGRVLHHNVDKCVLAGGHSEPKFGGGEIVDPIYLLMVGRATAEVAGREVPLQEIIEENVRRWLNDSVRFLDLDGDIQIDHRVRPGSGDLTNVFDRAPEIPRANDTSFGVGYAPLSETERVVYEAEKMLNSPEVQERHPYIGEDIKVMGVRVDDHLSLTVAEAFVSRHLPSLDAYKDAREQVGALVQELAEGITRRSVDVQVNTADDIEQGSVYITVSGTSAECGDDGQVGRGNRANGLITPYRPMTLEAAAGKNPINHVGKMYNIIADDIAQELMKTDGVQEVACYLVSRIGEPITRPQALDVKLRADLSESELKQRIEEITYRHLAGLPDLWKRIVAGGIENGEQPVMSLW